MGAGLTEYRPLKVRAETAEDMTVMAAYLQDAVVPVEDMAFKPGAEAVPGEFVLVAHRFRWEMLGLQEKPVAGDRYERVLCGITVQGVYRARLSGIDRQRDREDFLNLLTVQAAERDGAAHVDLIFAGDKAIRLEVARTDIVVEDFGEPWPTIFRPHHPVEAR
ncbi:MAG: DUF2948 family protein [Alphaproteobacteria bacterium]|nr:DUF2948 family protein [Alphaproteobacteria bacterium]MBU0798797.1 DUF2948 family protein [Alphaproteobacteria bacterium]MBU0886060.1 DUF2948 family protein [Alphaproteobacteria bacterium]MBU1812049.1 DUF2948 family protein [Alphaproteobacteria bacterium]